MYRGGSLVVIDDAEDREDAMEGSSGPVPYWISRESEDVDFYSEPEDENCYICEAPPVCPVAGYVSFNGVCYKDFAELKTYDEARQTCAADGGLLAMPKDDATNTFIHNLGGGAGIRWIGLTDLGNEGQFVYEDGQSLASSGYSNWHPGEPNDAHQGEHCVMMFDTTHGWNDATCSLARGFICQLG
ncbi:PREDICTED: collectin-10-like [Branchiostoma belcheri]|uniref:Collectin-10-like n=1 Tax=Branchiostoma belcheri TaxID=7741 RepID=A0A6P5A550_BRABE|nr:PREDICTED: collectin-10-like [Branchiostoma belcheri]